MKIPATFLFLTLLLAFASQVQAADPAPVDIHFSVIQQLADAPFRWKTNLTKSSTNILLHTKLNTSEYVIDSSRLLKMLANSYNTNFPTNATVKMTGNSILVVSGTDVILNASDVVGLRSNNLWVVTGTDNTEDLSSHKGHSSIIHYNETGYFQANFDYDDSLLSTRDGNTTRFSVQGLEIFRDRNTVLNDQLQTYNFAVNFTGGGIGSVSNATSFNRLVISGDLSSRMSSGK
jgi:hypothetical protein